MKYWLIVASVTLVLASCTVSSGLNKPCSLPKKIDGGIVVPITEQEVQENSGANETSTRDFIAFGAVDCEDLVCVRDATFPKGTMLDQPAIGYCSRPCAKGLACPSDDPALDQRGDTRMTCRALLLSKEVLAQLPISAKEPYFCARGGLGDAGVGN